MNARTTLSCRRAAAALALMLLQAGMPALAQSRDELEAQFGPQALEQRHTHAAVDVITLGDGAQRVYVFVPVEPALHGKVPMVFLHHGWQGMNPKNFGGLIDHLARSGQVVIYPVYQESAQTSPQIVTQAAAQADRRALAALAEQRQLTPDPQRVLYYGYSMGAAISLNLALDPKRYQLPAPTALVLSAPGDAYHVVHGEQGRSIIGPVEKLPADLPVAIIAGSADTSIGLPTGRSLAARLCGIRADRRVLMVFSSDENNGTKVLAGHGSPGAPDSRYDFPLTKRVAGGNPPNHSIPTHIAGRHGFEASGSLNQLDFYGYWKVLDAMIDGLRDKQLPDTVFGHGTPTQLYLGSWPDGSAYTPITLEQPCS
ncbi:alpha/beta hydrolase fold domain-containing protein [Dyella silvatica]|uniref:alpha/beta hydrolase fold domain-containing protein n=1 Tax=Dyella silvatica TaxID=2992128 RepID=UPI00225A5F52|nr:alpha/beta hydrolase fold domain-containing protein [Dyella silvatica]